MHYITIMNLIYTQRYVIRQSHDPKALRRRILRRPPIIIIPRRRRIISKAIILKVDLSAPLLQHRDNVVERAETVRVWRVVSGDGIAARVDVAGPIAAQVLEPLGPRDLDWGNEER